MVNVLHFLFMKGIEINLDDESFEIIKIRSGESKSCKNISDWINIFVEEGNVHPDDIESFLRFNNVDNFRTHFNNSDKPLTFKYRRRLGSEWESVMTLVTKSCKWSDQNPRIIMGIMSLNT